MDPRVLNLERRVLRVVRVDHGGPRSRNVLEGIARTPFEQRVVCALLDLMLTSGALAKYGDRKGATYGRPPRR